MTEASLRRKIEEQLKPVHFECVNESYKHNVPKGSETHFKVLPFLSWALIMEVVVVSDQFEALSLLKQHQLINTILKEELSTGVHALAIKTMTPKKWHEAQEVQFSTPNCLGGEKKAKKDESCNTVTSGAESRS